MRLRRRKGLCLPECLLVVIVLSGCTQGRSPVRAAPDPGLSAIPSPTIQLDGEASLKETVSPANPVGILDLPQALSHALAKSPELSSFSWELRMAEARVLQAGLLPNPEVEVEIEDFGGPANRRDFETSTSTVRLSQLIQLSGKREKKTRVAVVEKGLAEWNYEAKRLDVLTEVAKAFVGVLGAQEQVSVAAQLVQLSEQALRTVSERVKAGKISPLAETKSRVELANTRIELEKAKSGLKAARKSLSNTWGQSEPTFEKAVGTLDAVRPIPSLEDLDRLLSRNPDVARWAKEAEARTAALEFEKAKRVPDITVSGGAKQFNETDDYAFVLGVTIPIPIFDRNQGGILEARHKLAKARDESRAAVVKAGTALAEAYRELSSSYAEAVSLKQELLPAAELSFQAAGEGYREGKFDFLEFLDAQRTLFEAKGKYITTLTTYHKAAAEIERLTRERLDAAMETPKE